MDFLKMIFVEITKKKFNMSKASISIKFEVSKIYVYDLSKLTI